MADQSSVAGREEQATEVRVTWAELFSDLVFVFAVTEVSTLLRGDHTWLGRAGMLFGGTALYLATFGYTRWRMFGGVSWTRLTAAAVVAALSPVVAVVAVALNVVEHVLVRRRSR